MSEMFLKLIIQEIIINIATEFLHDSQKNSFHSFFNSFVTFTYNSVFVYFYRVV